MSDIQNPNGFEANETIDGVNDIMHIFQPGSSGTRRNKRIILNTLKVFFQFITGGTLNNIVTIGSSEELQDSGVAVADIINSYKGLNRIALTNYTSTGVPAIAANSVCEINGTLYTNPSEVAITGSTSNDTWYDILLTPSGTTFTASFIARGTGVWSDSKQGLYSGNNRVVAIARRDSSSSIWINKNILIVKNRTIKIKMEIGDWDMNVSVAGSVTVNIAHGLVLSAIISVFVLIRNDADSIRNMIASNTALSAPLDAIVSNIDATNILLGVRSTGNFDDADYNATTYNRGWIPIEYEV